MVEFVSVEEARQRSGLRVVMVGIVPSPWGEAAKGILYHKAIPYVAARLSAEGPAVKEWTGHDSAPIAVYENEAPRTGWAEILLLAERLAPASPRPDASSSPFPQSAGWPARRRPSAARSLRRALVVSGEGFAPTAPHRRAARLLRQPPTASPPGNRLPRRERDFRAPCDSRPKTRRSGRRWRVGGRPRRAYRDRRW